jgi:hypothetical protein
MDPDLFEKMTNLEAVSTVSLDPDQLHLLASVVEEFLAARKYNKPKKAFAEDLISKLNMNIGPNGMFESLYGAGENEEGFERQSMERKVPSMNEVFIWETSPQVKDMKKAVNSMEKTRDLKKASAKEKKEHPWATKKQATQIAIDHAKEGKP